MTLLCRKVHMERVQRAARCFWFCAHGHSPGKRQQAIQGLSGILLLLGITASNKLRSEGHKQQTHDHMIKGSAAPTHMYCTWARTTWNCLTTGDKIDFISSFFP